MATGELSPSGVSPVRTRPEQDLLSRLLSAFASLKLTVVLFALSIFLVFMGTLAQKDQGVWEVVEQTYFRVWFARIDFQSFLRLFQMWTKTEAPPIPGGFWYPGGLLLGTLLGLNLLAAHSIRFKVAARGQRLMLGLGVIGVGLTSAAVLIAADQRGAVEGVFSPIVQAALWHLLRAGVAGVALFAGYLVVSGKHGLGTIEKVIAGSVAALSGAIALWLYANPDVRLDPSGLRILWILGLCSLVSAVLLAGCGLLFKKRAGIVLIHAGVLLLMVGELLTGLAADEGQMQIREGESTNYALDIRTTELAVVDSSGELEDVVTVVPQHLLSGSKTITDEALPFEIRPLKFLQNSFLAPATGTIENLATQGAGLGLVAVPVQSASGVDMNAGVDLPSAYVELLKKGSAESLGVYLVSNSGDRTGRSLTPQVVEVDGKPYELQLRFKRQYKPYSVELVDFRFDRYAGSDMAKNFSSDVIIHDPLRSIDRKARIWMNNPTRHAGDTLYQQSYDKATEAATVLQVVTNTGRLIPYLSCAMVGLGLLAHFGQTLVRFIRRRESETAKALAAAPRDENARGIDWSSPAVLIPLVVAGLLAFYAIGKARPAVDAPDAMPVQRFGALAMVDNGRVKPYDTYARNVLQTDLQPAGDRS